MLKKNKSKKTCCLSLVACRQSKKGFSLMEILVVFAIIIIMTAVLLTNQYDGKAQKDIEVSALQVVAQLRLLQNEALNGKQIGGTTGTSVCGFKMTVTGGTTNYGISYYDCASNALIAGASQTIELNSNKKNVLFDNSWSGIISFSAPMGRLAGGVSQQVILVSRTYPSKKIGVCVCNSGNIFDTKDFSSSACTTGC